MSQDCPGPASKPQNPYGHYGFPVFCYGQAMVNPWVRLWSDPRRSYREPSALYTSTTDPIIDRPQELTIA